MLPDVTGDNYHSVADCAISWLDAIRGETLRGEVDPESHSRIRLLIKIAAEHIRHKEDDVADESPWKPIETAPKYTRVDILAKRWIAYKDEFEFERFPDCEWQEAMNSTAGWMGIDTDWLAVGWMPVPLLHMEASIDG